MCEERSSLLVTGDCFVGKNTLLAMTVCFCFFRLEQRRFPAADPCAAPFDDVSTGSTQRLRAAPTLRQAQGTARQGASLPTGCFAKGTLRGRNPQGASRRPTRWIYSQRHVHIENCCSQPRRVLFDVFCIHPRDCNPVLTRKRMSEGRMLGKTSQSLVLSLPSRTGVHRIASLMPPLFAARTVSK